MLYTTDFTLENFSGNYPSSKLKKKDVSENGLSPGF
jgi:hypothetical protein